MRLVFKSAFKNIIIALGAVSRISLTTVSKKLSRMSPWPHLRPGSAAMASFPSASSRQSLHELEQKQQQPTFESIVIS